MCRAKWEGGGRRCKGRTKWCVNREGHDRFAPDESQERHWFKPTALLSMTPGAIRLRRHRAMAYAREVDAIRTVHGVAPLAAIGPVLREALWSHRANGAGLSLITLADRFKAIADEEGVSVEEVADRYATQQIKPHRQRAGERLAELVVTDADRPDWVDEDHLVRMIEPPENGTPNPAYVSIVKDADGAEWVLVRSYDGSEPMAWPNDAAGLKAGAAEALDRVRAANDSEDYFEWAQANDVAAGPNPWTQDMEDADFLAHSDGMHLV